MQFNKTFNLNDLNNFSQKKKDKYFKNSEKGLVTKATSLGMIPSTCTDV